MDISLESNQLHYLYKNAYQKMYTITPNLNVKFTRDVLKRHHTGNIKQKIERKYEISRKICSI